MIAMDAHWLHSLAGILNCVNAALGLWIFNGQSEDIKESIDEIREDILRLKVSNKFVKVFGNYHPEEYARTIVLDKMEKFHGFEACGFITLGKPLLSSLFSNFITYLIILLQFKISES